MADDIDPLRIDRERCLDLGDDAGEVGRVVDALAVEVAARVGRIPEPVPVVVERPVGVDIQVAALRGELAEMEVEVVFAAGRTVAMEDDEERCRTAGVVARRNDDGHGPITADIDRLLAGRGRRGRTDGEAAVDVAAVDAGDAVAGGALVGRSTRAGDDQQRGQAQDRSVVSQAVS